jgi:hypothetical protein
MGGNDISDSYGGGEGGRYDYISGIFLMRTLSEMSTFLPMRKQALSLLHRHSLGNSGRDVGSGPVLTVVSGELLRTDEKSIG